MRTEVKFWSIITKKGKEGRKETNKTAKRK